jgi:hypothetical protein
MNNNATPRTAIDFLSGTGVMSTEITPVVESAIVKTIEKLLANHNVEDLTDGNLISYSLMRYTTLRYPSLTLVIITRNGSKLFETERNINIVWNKARPSMVVLFYYRWRLQVKKGKITHKPGQEHRTALIKLLEKFQHQFNIWQVWDDMVYFCAAALSQPCQWVQAREDEYLRRIQRYPKDLQELFPQMLAEIVLAFEQEGFADVLGSMYMDLNLGNHWKGQFFTPYEVALMMAKMSGDNPAEEIKQNGFSSVSDSSCGSGVMLIAAAQNYFDNKVNYQQNVLFVGQDVDSVVALMAFIQMSLLGMPGYVIIGNSFTQPLVGDALFPKIGKINENIPDADIWFTPMFFTDVWRYRRLWQTITRLFKDETS